MRVNRIFCWYIMLIICLFVPLSSPVISYSAEVPTTVVEVFHNSHDIVAPEPEGSNTEVLLVPLRSMLDPHGIIIKYNTPNESRRDTTTFTLNIGSNNIGSTQVDLNPGSRTSGRLFFLESPPRIINGQTMVPSNFIQEVLDTIQNRAQHLEKIVASDYPVDVNSIANQKGYKFYCLTIGPEIGPTINQAIIYATENKLLQVVTRAEDTPNGFEEFGSRSTMVVGKDKLGREKAVWITQNKYTEELSVIALVYLDQIIPIEVVYDKMQTREIKEKKISKVYLAPYKPGKLLWYVQANKDNTDYYLAFDALSGEVHQEWSIKR